MTDPGGRRSIDWAEVRERIAATRRAAAESLAASPERARRLIEERAQRLAAASQPDAALGAPRLLCLSHGGASFAVEARWVVAVVRAEGLVPVPGGAPALAGILAVRGEVVPVMDLAVFVGATSDEGAGASRLVVLGRAAPELALLADAVTPIVPGQAEPAAAAPSWLPRPRSPFIAGFLPGGRVLLDGAALLSDTSILQPADAP